MVECSCRGAVGHEGMRGPSEPMPPRFSLARAAADLAFCASPWQLQAPARGGRLPHARVAQVKDERLAVLAELSREALGGGLVDDVVEGARPLPAVVERALLTHRARELRNELLQPAEPVEARAKDKMGRVGGELAAGVNEEMRLILEPV